MPHTIINTKTGGVRVSDNTFTIGGIRFRVGYSVQVPDLFYATHKEALHRLSDRGQVTILAHEEPTPSFSPDSLLDFALEPAVETFLVAQKLDESLEVTALTESQTEVAESPEDGVTDLSSEPAEPSELSTVEDNQPHDVDYTKWRRRDLTEALDQLGVQYTSAHQKADLVDLLVKAQVK